jgi:uncharacterized protein (TIGR00645 family)
MSAGFSGFWFLVSSFPLAPLPKLRLQSYSSDVSPSGNAVDGSPQPLSTTFRAMEKSHSEHAEPKPPRPKSHNPAERFIERIVFTSRWLQAPMYIGLVLGAVIYEYKFLEELWHMFHGVWHGDHKMSEEAVMLSVLTLVDMIMVANLIFMVVLGGYTIFVSRIDFDEHPDRPEWLEKTNAASLKIKLASSLVGVSGVHLLKSFINLEEKHGDYDVVKWQILIHITFLMSSLILAVSERTLYGQTKH